VHAVLDVVKMRQHCLVALLCRKHTYMYCNQKGQVHVHSFNARRRVRSMQSGIFKADRWVHVCSPHCLPRPERYSPTTTNRTHPQASRLKRSEPSCISFVQAHERRSVSRPDQHEQSVKHAKRELCTRKSGIDLTMPHLCRL
jgi:hypothetical protein